MKQSKRIMSIVSLVIITIVNIFAYDIVQRNNLYNIRGNDFIEFEILYDGEIDYDSIEKLIHIAKSNGGVIETTSITSYEEEFLTTIYSSEETVGDILKKRELEFSNSERSVKDGVGATYDTGDSNQTYFIYDFLDNEKILYKTFNHFFSESGYVFKDYKAYFTNANSAKQFIEESKQLLGSNINYLTNDNKEVNIAASPSLIAGTTTIVVITGVLFYFVFEIINIYNQSKRISVYKMLGLDRLTIFKVMLKNDAVVSIATILILDIVIGFIVPNINIDFYLGLILSQVIFLILCILLSMTSIVIILHKQSTINLLKKQNIANPIIKITDTLKFVITIIMVIILSQSVLSINSLMTKKKTLQEYHSLSNFAIFSKINIENDFFSDNGTRRLTNFYQDLQKSDIVNVYSEFNEFQSSEKRDIDEKNHLIDEKTYFPIASINMEFVLLNDLELVDDSGSSIAYSSLNNELSYLMIPVSSRNDREYIKQYYNNELSKEFEMTVEEKRYDVIYYLDKNIKTYTVNSSNGEVFNTKLSVEYPVLRLLSSNFSLNYIDSPLGVDVAGTGVNTGLKFMPHNEKIISYEALEAIISKNELNEVLPRQLFTSIGELQGKEIVTAKNDLYLSSILLLVSLLIYLLLSIENIRLYIDKEKQRISIKLFLGYSRTRILKELFLLNIIQNLFALLVPITLVLLGVLKGDISLLVLASLMVFIFESLIFYATTSKVRLRDSIRIMKGKDND